MGGTCCKGKRHGHGSGYHHAGHGGKKHRPNQLGISPSAAHKHGKRDANFDSLVLQPGPDGRLQFPQRQATFPPAGGVPPPAPAPLTPVPPPPAPITPYTSPAGYGQASQYGASPPPPPPPPAYGGAAFGAAPAYAPASPAFAGGSPPTSARAFVLGGGMVDPAEPVFGLLSLRVMSAEVARPADHPMRAGPSLHVVVSLGATSFTTEPRPATNPFFNEAFKLVVLEKERGAELSLTLNDGNLVGRGSLKLSEIAPAPEAGEMYPVEKVVTVYEKVPGFFRDSMEARGAVRVSVALQGAPSIERGFFNALVRMFDTDGDGLVSRPELSALLQALCRTASPQELDALYAGAGMPPGAPMGPVELHAARHALDAGGHLIRYTECPVCAKPLPPGDSAQFCHVGLCFMEGGEPAVDAFLLKGLLHEQSTSRTWVQKLLAGAVLPPEYTQEAAGIPVVNRETGTAFIEPVPPMVKIPLAALCAGPPGPHEEEAKAALLRLSAQVAQRFEGPNSAALIEDFVARHGIDVSELDQPLGAYRTFGEFWSRRVRPEARPIHQPQAARVAVCPVDGRCVVFPNVVAATQLWIKGRRFTVAELLGLDPRQAAQFEQCSLALFRMAPGDYHRVHAPVDGTVRVQPIDGALLPIDSLSLRAGVDSLTTNRRVRVDITGSPLGNVSMALVGSTFAGSIQVGVKPNTRVRKGQELAYFALGGSCVVVVFQKGPVNFAPDLGNNSMRPVETLVKMGSFLAGK